MLAITQFYLSAIVLMLPLLFCVGIGVFWGKRDIPFGGAFITTLVTSVTTPALVFHTFVTPTWTTARWPMWPRPRCWRCCCARWSPRCC